MDGTTGTSANGVWQYGFLPDLADAATGFGVYDVTTTGLSGVTGLNGYLTDAAIVAIQIPLLLGNQSSPQTTLVDGNASFPPGFVDLHPGASGDYSALRFVAPSSGVYGFTGQFQGNDSTPTTTDVHILQITAGSGASPATSTNLMSGTIDGYYGGGAAGSGTPTTPSAIVPFDLAGVALNAGDSVLFAVGAGTSYYSDSTGLKVQATFTPAASGSLLPDDPFGYLGGLGYWQDPALSASALADTAGSGLSYVRQRWLENATGQWLSVDPVVSEPRYDYAGNSPTLNVDPLGTRSMRDVARQDIAAPERQIRRGGHWGDQQISRRSHWADQQSSRAIPWVEQEIQGPWMGHSLVSLVEEGVRWAERRFGNGSSSSRAAASPRRSAVGQPGRHALNFGHENSGWAPPGWLQTGLNAARQVEAVVGNAVRVTIHVAEGVTHRVIIDPLTSVVEAVSPGAKQLYARASQTWPRFTSIISQIWNTLERVFYTTTSHWERIRRGLPPLLANVAPPPPTDVAGSAEYLIGLIWGALQALFGIVAAVATIPAIVEFLHFLFTKIRRRSGL